MHDLRESIAKKTNMEVWLIIKDSGIEVVFKKKVKIPFSYRHFHTLEYIEVLTEHTELQPMIDRAVAGIETKLANPPFCCGNAFGSNGWNHDTRCPNWVMPF